MKREMFPGAETEQPTGLASRSAGHGALALRAQDPQGGRSRYGRSRAVEELTSRFEVVMFVEADITHDEGGFFRLTPRTMRRLAERGISLLAEVEDQEDE